MTASTVKNDMDVYETEIIFGEMFPSVRITFIDVLLVFLFIQGLFSVLEGLRQYTDPLLTPLLNPLKIIVKKTYKA